MSTATSSSDRYAEAREALAQYDSGATESGDAIAVALRALIEPPATESPTELQIAFEAELREEGSIRVLGFEQRDMPPISETTEHDRLGLAYRLGVQAGIQAAWETWEPDDYAPIHDDWLDDIENVRGADRVDVSWSVIDAEGCNLFHSDMSLTEKQAVGMFKGIGKVSN